MLSLDYRDARPIYEQVKDGLRRLMVSGVIREGEKLPSVRTLASTLAINPNTLQKAYEALEAEGYVRSIPGKGSFASPHTGWMRPGGRSCSTPLTRRRRSFCSWGWTERRSGPGSGHWKGERHRDTGEQRGQDL